jgi:hypothetical protein
LKVALLPAAVFVRSGKGAIPSPRESEVLVLKTFLKWFCCAVLGILNSDAPSFIVEVTLQADFGEQNLNVREDIAT